MSVFHHLTKKVMSLTITNISPNLPHIVVGKQSAYGMKKLRHCYPTYTRVILMETNSAENSDRKFSQHNLYPCRKSTVTCFLL